MEKGDNRKQRSGKYSDALTVRYWYFLSSIISSMIVLQSTSMIPSTCVSEAATVETLRRLLVHDTVPDVR